MVEAAAGFIAELVPAIAVGIVDIVASVLVASARPWNWVFSPSHREQARIEMGRRSAWARCWWMAWGTAVLAVSAGGVALIGLLLASSPGKSPSAASDVLRGAAREIATRATQSAPASAAKQAVTRLRR